MDNAPVIREITASVRVRSILHPSSCTKTVNSHDISVMLKNLSTEYYLYVTMSGSFPIFMMDPIKKRTSFFSG
jgi:hypothetical protein